MEHLRQKYSYKGPKKNKKDKEQKQEFNIQDSIASFLPQAKRKLMEKTMHEQELTKKIRKNDGVEYVEHVDIE